jgi:DNA (cytosine-5)-methyltransferase 1
MKFVVKSLYSYEVGGVRLQNKINEVNLAQLDVFDQFPELNIKKDLISEEYINKYIDVEQPLPSKKVYKVVSLFSGCGGKDFGVIGGFDIFNRHYEKNNYEIVFANDIVKQACDTYRHNFGHDIVCADIKDINADIIPSADIVIGGFPCQDFSVAGKRKGLSADRGRLYLEMKRVIDKIKPIAFIAENVEGITNVDSSDDTINTIISGFKDSGYNVTFNLFNAADYGVPQQRKRVFIVGIRQDINKKFYLPKTVRGDGRALPWMTSKEAIDDLWDKIDDPSIFNHTSKDFSKAKFYEGKRMQGNCQISADKPSCTIRAEHHGNIEGHYRTLKPENPLDMSGWRRLSVRECARIQTFPDNFKFMSAASTAYKQVGNAVPPILGWYIARALYFSLEKE